MLLSDYYYFVKEVLCRQVNEWICYVGVFDVVIDFDVVLCDLEQLLWFVVCYDFGDYLYFSDEGNWVMVVVVDFDVLLDEVFDGILVEFWVDSVMK